MRSAYRVTLFHVWSFVLTGSSYIIIYWHPISVITVQSLRVIPSHFDLLQKKTGNVTHIILRRTERDMIINVHWSLYMPKVLVILFRF